MTRANEIYYSEGYNERCKEIKNNTLINIEGYLYEVTKSDFIKFMNIRSKRDNWHKSLNFIQTKYEPITNKFETYYY